MSMIYLQKVLVFNLCEVLRGHLIPMASINSTICSNNTLWASNSPVLMICSPRPILGSLLVPDLCCSIGASRFQESPEFAQVLENVREMWTEVPHGGKKKAKPVNKDRASQKKTGTCLLCVGIENYHTHIPLPPRKKTGKPAVVLNLFTSGAKHRGCP